MGRLRKLNMASNWVSQFSTFLEEPPPEDILAQFMRRPTDEHDVYNLAKIS